MTRILAIDFGEKRIGVAISDPVGRVVLPLTTLSRRSDAEVIRSITELIEREQIEVLVVGDPRNVDGSRGESSVRVDSFCRKLETASGLPCEHIAETLTSEAAKERLREAGVDLRRHRERIDAVAAQIVLEEYLAALDRGASDV